VGQRGGRKEARQRRAIRKRDSNGLKGNAKNREKKVKPLTKIVKILFL